MFRVESLAIHVKKPPSQFVFPIQSHQKPPVIFTVRSLQSLRHTSLQLLQELHIAFHSTLRSLQSISQSLIERKHNSSYPEVSSHSSSYLKVIKRFQSVTNHSVTLQFFSVTLLSLRPPVTPNRSLPVTSEEPPVTWELPVTCQPVTSVPFQKLPVTSSH